MTKLYVNDEITLFDGTLTILEPEPAILKFRLPVRSATTKLK